MNKCAAGVLLALVLILAIVVAILAALYGTKFNCKDDDVKVVTPAMVHFSQIQNLNISNKSFKPIAYSTIAGKEMTGGLFRLNAGSGLSYTQWYEGFILVISGAFNITDGTGQRSLANAFDAVYIRRGTKVTYSTNTPSLLYYVAQPPGPEKSLEVQTAIDSNPNITVIIKDVKTLSKTMPKLVNTSADLSYLKDYLLSKIKGKELAGGLYLLKKGPALEYTYTYEEFKYIVDGEFHLADRAGKVIIAKTGDLMYFPKGTYVHFTSPNYALGFFVGQRLGDTA